MGDDGTGSKTLSFLPLFPCPFGWLDRSQASASITPEEIQSVEVGVSSTGHKLIGAPEELKTNPVSVVDGQFSMPFCAAVVLSEGNLVWDDYPTHLKNSSTLDLCRKVRTLLMKGLRVFSKGNVGFREPENE